MFAKTALLTATFMLFSGPAFGQIIRGYDGNRDYENQSVFVLLGYVWGPHFSDFVEWTNNHYAQEFGSTDSIEDFKGGIDIGAGLRKRFSRYFGLEFKIGYHTSSIKKQFDGYDGALPFSQTQNLNLNVMKIAVSPMILFDFYDSQPIVPFVSAGVTFFSMRLDHAIDYYVRHTKVALASNFSVGIETPLTRKIKGDIRGDWTIGSARMPVSQLYGQPESFKMSLNTSQIHFGVVFGLE
jgi:hypothetical protein